MDAARLRRAFARSGRYRAIMLPILKQEGVPQDLIYLAQAESGFHPLAVSTRRGSRHLAGQLWAAGRGGTAFRVASGVDDRWPGSG